MSSTFEPNMWAWYMSIALLSLGFVLWGIARGKHKVQAKPEEKKTSNKTWRLFITPEHGMESTPVISDADLCTAIGKKFRVDLTGTRLVLVREPERYCATLSLKSESLPFVDGRTFTVDVLQEEGRKISASIMPDKGFLGMTTLYDGTKDASAVDFIVVPGLSSHPFGSFKSPDDPSLNWLRDCLPCATGLSNIRILVYGYNSILLEHEGKETILDFAKGLLESIHSYRQDAQTERRPIIFIAHSLGGLLVKQALWVAMDQPRKTTEVTKDETLLKSCTGFLFFGVPNLGLRHKELEAIVKDSALMSLVRDLLVNGEAEYSSLLRVLNQNFIRCSEAYPFNIVSFYETLPSNTTKLEEKGSLSRSGPKTLMVTQESATRINGTSDDRKQIPITATHSGLVKFKGMHDPEYKERVLPNIRDMLRDARTTVNARFSYSRKLSSIQRNILAKLQRTPVHDLLDSSINDAYKDTLNWVYGVQEFTEWRDSPKSSLLWVHGSPGQGKSVLAKFLVKSLERSVPRERLVISFFCSSQWEYLRRPTDILQALILQLITCQELFELLPQRYEDDSQKFFDDSLPSLWGVFKTLILDTRHEHICCVIDALDECSPVGKQRSDLMRRLVELFSTSQGRRKLLVTSRYGEADINCVMRTVPRWCLTAQKDDLDVYIQSKVHELDDSAFDNQLKMQVQSSLCPKAGTTFLWVSMVMKQIAGLTAPCRFDISRILGSPTELNELYTKLVRQLASDPILARILAWVTYAERALTINELREAIQFDPSQREYKRLAEMDDYRRPFTEDLVRRSLGNLLYVHTQRQSNTADESTTGYVVFNHETGKEFLRSHGKSLLNECGVFGYDDPELYLARTCLFYLTAEEFTETARLQKDTVSAGFHNAQLSQTFQAGDHALEDSTRLVETRCLEYWQSLPVLVYYSIKSRRIQKKSLVLANMPPRSCRDGHVSSEATSTPDAVTLGKHLSKYHSFHLLSVASIGWYKHIKTRLQGEKEWAKIGSLLDHKQPFLGVWIRGLLEGGKLRCLEDLLVRCPEYEDTPYISVVDLTIALDIVWLAETLFAKQLAKKSFNAVQICRMPRLAPRLFEHFFIERTDVSISADVLTAIAKSKDGIRLLDRLRHSRPMDFKITGRSLEAAAENEDEGDSINALDYLLGFGENIEVTDECLRVAARKPRPRLMEFLLSRRYGNIDIWGELFEITTNAKKRDRTRQDHKNFDALIDILERLLLRVKVTDGTMLAVIQGDSGLKLIQLLLRERPDNLSFTEGIMVAVCKGLHAEMVLTMILGQNSVPVEVTDKVFCSAIELSSKAGQNTVPVHSTDEVAYLAFERNSRERHLHKTCFVMDLLLRTPHRRTNISDTAVELALQELSCTGDIASVLDMRTPGSKVTEMMLTAAADNQYCGMSFIQILFRHGRGQVRITEETLVAAGRNQGHGLAILKWILQKLPDQFCITDAILLAVVGNQKQGMEILEWLLEKFPDRIRITEPILLAAARNEAQAKAMLKWIFQELSEQAQITERLLLAVADNMCQADEVLKWLLQDFDNQLPITDAVLAKFAYHPIRSEHILRMLLSHDSTNIVRKTVLQATATAWLESTEMFSILSQRRPCTERLPNDRPFFKLSISGSSTVEHCVQGMTCDAISEVSFRTLELLRELFGPRGGVMQTFLFSDVGAKAAPLGFPGAWITLKRLPHTTRNDCVWITLLNGLSEELPEARPLITEMMSRLASSDNGVGHLRSNTHLLTRYENMPSHMLDAAAASGQSGVLGILFELFPSTESTQAKATRSAHFCQASKAGDEREITRLLSDGVSPDLPDLDNHAPLWHACVGGHLRAAQCLLETGSVLVDRIDSLGLSPLHWAAALNEDKILKLLLQHGAELDRKSRMGLTAQRLAHRFAAESVKEVLKDLVCGTNQDTVDDSSENEDLQDETGVRRLLDSDGAIKTKLRKIQRRRQIADGANCRTALHLAARSGNVQMAKAHLNRGASVNPGSQTLASTLRLAAEYGHTELVRLCLEHVADVNVQDTRGQTALHASARFGHPGIAQLLLESGADVNLGRKNGTAVYCAAAYGQREVVNTLRRYGASTDEIEAGERTAQYIETHGGIENTIKHVNKRLCAIDGRDSRLHKAVKTNLELARFVYYWYGEGVNVRSLFDDGNSVLHVAILNGQVETALWILSLQPDLDVINGQGNTPLHAAVLQNLYEIVVALLEAGASTAIHDNAYSTPLHSAVSRGFDSLVELLLLNGADGHTLDYFGHTCFDLIKFNPEMCKKMKHLITEPLEDLKSRRTFRQANCLFALTRKLLKRDGAPTGLTYSRIGHCVLFLQQYTENENIQASREPLVAYEQHIARSSSNGDIFHPEVNCRNCRKEIVGTRVICITCLQMVRTPKVDVCGDCWDKYGKDSLQFGCTGHDFLSVPGPGFFERDSRSVNDSGETRREWLSRIKDSWHPLWYWNPEPPQESAGEKASESQTV